MSTNLTVLIGTSSRPTSQFHCSVHVCRVINFQWIFSSSMSLYGSSGIQPIQQPISNEVGSLDPKYSIISSDYSSVLTIQDVEFSDAGNYTCVASIGSNYRISPIRSTAILTVHGTYTINSHRIHVRVMMVCLCACLLVIILYQSSLCMRIYK